MSQKEVDRMRTLRQMVFELDALADIDFPEEHPEEWHRHVGSARRALRAAIESLPTL